MTEKLSLSEFKKLSTEKANKYRNKKAFYKGIEFDSRKEMHRYLELCGREKSGEIRDLKTQEKFELIPKHGDEMAVTYRCDFSYFDKEVDSRIVEDVKSEITKKKSDYVIKRKLFKFKYPDIIFIET